MSDHMQPRARALLEQYGLVIYALERDIEAIYAERDALAARVGALREALLRFGAHEQNCDVYEMDEEGSGRCNCGYAAAMASPSAPVEAAPEAPAERRGRVHCLKTWPEFFREVKAGNKPFEVRRNDRDFRVGDVLALQEWDRGRQEYTGDVLTRRVSYLLEGPAFGIGAGFVVMGLEGCAPEAPAEPVAQEPRALADLPDSLRCHPGVKAAIAAARAEGAAPWIKMVSQWRAAYSAYGLLATPPDHPLYSKEASALLSDTLRKTDAALRALPVEAPNAAGKAPAR